MKTCTKCGVEKALDAFYKKGKGLGRFGHCKACHLVMTNRYRDTNRERIREKERERYAANPEGARAKWRANHPPKDAAYAAKRATLKMDYAARRANLKLIWERAKQKAGPEKRRAWSTNSNRKSVADLTDAYVAWALIQKTGLKRAALPGTLIEAKREHLRLVRLIKETAK